MLTDWDVLLLQECFRKLDGVNVGAHELFSPSPSSHHASEMEQTRESCWRERADGLRSSWMDRSSPNASQREEVCRFRVGFDTLMDTNDSLRARALHAVVAELDLRVTNSWMDAGPEQELYTRCSWTDPGDADTHGLYYDLKEIGSKTGARAGLRLGQDRQGGACCSFR